MASEPTTDRVDSNGRPLRYIIPARDGVNVNVRLVTEGVATPYFYDGRRGTFARRLEALAKRARAKRRRLSGRAHTPKNGLTERRRSRTDRAWDYHTAQVLKTRCGCHGNGLNRSVPGCAQVMRDSVRDSFSSRILDSAANWPFGMGHTSAGHGAARRHASRGSCGFCR